jgi:hypothetical protein
VVRCGGVVAAVATRVGEGWQWCGMAAASARVGAVARAREEGVGERV